MRSVVLVSVVAVASVAFMFRSSSPMSEKVVRISCWPVQIWVCASLMLRQMVGRIVLVQALRSDVLA
jgi:hypothetical protein